ncbi:unnamed protein product [Effrenium voratum]|nr:unnamed protein product [Effrenium voratum]
MMPEPMEAVPVVTAPHTHRDEMIPSPMHWRTVCLLEVVSIQWIPLCPWTRTQQVTSSGSGFLISQNRIMTNAHAAAKDGVREKSWAKQSKATFKSCFPFTWLSNATRACAAFAAFADAPARSGQLAELELLHSPSSILVGEAADGTVSQVEASLVASYESTYRAPTRGSERRPALRSRNASVRQMRRPVKLEAEAERSNGCSNDSILAPAVDGVSIPESGHSPRMHTIQQTLESHLHPKKGKSHLAVRHQENTPPQKVAVKPGKKGCCCRVNDMLLQVIRHPMFDLSMSILIIINTLLFAFEAQYKGFNLAQALGLSEEHAEEVWPGARDFFENSEMIFGIIFTVEVAARLLLERLGFASDCWNWLDLSIVLFWLFSKTGSVLPVNSQVLRLLRLFRLLRMLSLVRKIKEFDALFLMTTAVRSSFGVLGWTAALLFVCQMMCALVIQQALSSS